MARKLRRFVLALTASILLTGATLPELRVQVREGKLTVHAQSAPLYGVLWAISAQTGIKVNIPGGARSAELAELLVTEDFTDLPLAQGLSRLLENHLQSSNYVIITDQKTRLPQSIHILSTALSTTPSSNVAVASPSPAVAVGMRPTMSLEQALEAARLAKSPEEQVKALLALGSFQDPRTLEVLGPALYSKNAEVRKAALEAMRWGAVDDKVILKSIHSMATSDPDPAVRQAGLEVLVRYDASAEMQSLLKKLAAEPGGAHRDFALRELKRLEIEAKAANLPDPQLQDIQP
jgi:hypothetical protein